MDFEKRIEKLLRKIDPNAVWQEWSPSEQRIKKNMKPGEKCVHFESLGVWVAYK